MTRKAHELDQLEPTDKWELIGPKRYQKLRRKHGHWTYVAWEMMGHDGPNYLRIEEVNPPRFHPARFGTYEEMDAAIEAREPGDHEIRSAS